MRTRTIAATLLGACAAALLLSSAATAAPIWHITSAHGPTNMPAGGKGIYVILPRNMAFNTSASAGTNATSGAYEIIDRLPAGVRATEVKGNNWDCSGTSFPTPFGGTVTCTNESQVRARTASPTLGGQTNNEQRGVADPLHIEVEVEAGTEGSSVNEVEVSGGGAAAASTALDPTVFDPAPTPFGLSSFQAEAYDALFPEGGPVRQAGDRPFEARFDLDFKLKRTEHAIAKFGTFTEPANHVRDVVTTLPPGLLGNPLAAAQCTRARFAILAPGSSGGLTACPPATQVGTVDLLLNNVSVLFPQLPEGSGRPNTIHDAPLHNIVPPKGAVAAFAFAFQALPVHVLATVEPSGDPANPYEVVARARNVVEILPVRKSHLKIWGVPADPDHDVLRFHPSTTGQANNSYFNTPAEGEPKPFLTLPTNCTQASSTRYDLTAWLGGETASYETEPVTQTGCDQLVFEPTIEANPTTNRAEAPSGLDFELHVPQNEDPEGLATPHLKDTVVTLPEGMTVNPSSADGLDACSLDEIGFEPNGAPNGDPVKCPDASKLGTLTAVSPALEEPIPGEVFLAEQEANPFGSLLALYFVLEQPERGLLIKLAAEVKADPATGRLTTVLEQSPQLPVEDFEVHLADGPRASLKTPPACGSHTTTSTLTPWSSPDTPDAVPSDSFTLGAGPGGGACPAQGASAPNGPSFEAGTLEPTAGAFSPFILRLARADASQGIESIDATLPKGLLGSLAGTSFCPEAALAAAAERGGRAEGASPSCPLGSRLGTVTVGAGVGPSPLHVEGDAYLAGPYRGAPLSMAIVTPAVAGPFDLGTVVVRSALHVDPRSAQVRAVSDPIPQILEGIPLHLRSVALRLDRPDFTLNPTSCDRMAVLGAAISVFDQPAPLSSPFQVGQCGRLGFKPRLSLRMLGPSHRGAHPALRAVLRPRPGDANLERAAVTLPATELFENANIRTICTRVQYAADACPKGSVYGRVRAWTPLLDEPLSGPVYLRSSDNELPDLVMALRGIIDVEAVARIDAVRGRLRSTFTELPDAPLSKVVLRMRGGRKSLLVHTTDVCEATPRARVLLDAHNGKTHDFHPVVRTQCGKRR